jgi:hypothetical protein
LTAVSAIVFFLGLLFGFQRPSRLLLPRLCATVFLLLSSTLFNFGAALFISKRPSCQAAVAAPFHRFVPVRIQHRAFALCFFLSGGARNLLRFRIPCQLASSTLSSAPSRLCRLRDFRRFVGGSGFYHRRVGSQLRSPTFYFVFHCFVRSSWPPLRPRLPVRGGAASTTAASGVNTILRLRLPADTAWCARRSAASRGRGFYHRRV